jgi:hypothetical protein
LSATPPQINLIYSVWIRHRLCRLETINGTFAAAQLKDMNGGNGSGLGIAIYNGIHVIQATKAIKCIVIAIALETE